MDVGGSIIGFHRSEFAVLTDRPDIERLHTERRIGFLDGRDRGASDRTLGDTYIPLGLETESATHMSEAGFEEFADRRYAPVGRAANRILDDRVLGEERHDAFDVRVLKAREIFESGGAHLFRIGHS